MDPTLKRKQGQALVETLLVMPLWVLALTAFSLLHRVALEDFDDTRTLRQQLAHLSQMPDAPTLPSLENNSRVQLEVNDSWPKKKEEKTTRPPQGLNAPSFDFPLSLPGEFLDLLYEPRTVTLTKDRAGLWPDRQAEGTLLVPGSLRKQGHNWALTLSLYGAVK